MKGGGIEGLIAIVVILVIIGSALMYVAICTFAMSCYDLRLF